MRTLNCILEDYLKDLKEDIEYAIENEGCSIDVTFKDVEKINRLINSNRRKHSLMEQNKSICSLFERKFINYRNKLVSIYQKSSSEELRSEIKRFLVDEQGDIEFKS